jgi:hypothetical protein
MLDFDSGGELFSTAVYVKGHFPWGNAAKTIKISVLMI